MPKHKNIREKGKIGLSKFFKKLDEGDKVGIKIDLSFPFASPKRLQGKTGVIVGKKGRSLIISLKDGKKQKRFIISAVHLKKLK